MCQSQGLAVIFNIHGGGFVVGANAQGTDEAIDSTVVPNNVILVSTNYRLGWAGESRGPLPKSRHFFTFSPFTAESSGYSGTLVYPFKCLFPSERAWVRLAWRGGGALLMLFLHHPLFKLSHPCDPCG